MNVLGRSFIHGIFSDSGNKKLKVKKKKLLRIKKKLDKMAKKKKLKKSRAKKLKRVEEKLKKIDKILTGAKLVFKFF